MARRAAHTIVRRVSSEAAPERPRGTTADADRLAALYQHHQRIGAQGPPSAATVLAFCKAEILDSMAPSHIDRLAGWVLARLTA